METRYGNAVLANDLHEYVSTNRPVEYTSMEELKQTSYSVQESEELLTKLIEDHYSAKL